MANKLKCCSGCRVELPTEQFYPRRNRRNGLTARCKPCQSNYSKRQPSYRTQVQTKTYKRMSLLRRRYGLTLVGYDQLLASQGGGCAICGALRTNGKTSLPVDHDHQTGKVRGILCDPCNRAIGLLKDNPELLGRAQQYLLGAGHR